MTTATITSQKTPRRLIDIGINLCHRQFDRDRSEVIQRAIDEGNVGALILTGCSVKGSEEAQQYCAKTQAEVYPNLQLFSTAGVHPHDAKRCDSKTIDKLRRLAQTKQVVAIGECGLDYNRNFSPPPIQRKWFEHQLQLASELNMPVFLHERDAHSDFFDILKRYHERLPACVVHCFTGTKEQVEAYLSLPNCYIGITGWLCDERRGKPLRDVLL